MSDEKVTQPDKKDEGAANAQPSAAGEESNFDEVLDRIMEENAVAGSQDSPLVAKLRESEQRVLRVQADLENFRKRAVRDREDAIKYATTRLISDLLPVIDNLQRATQSQDGEAPSEGIMAGVNMVVQQLNAVLAQHNCNVIRDEGEFDPNLHEAILQQPNNEVEAGQIIMATQTGYKLHDRVLRPTQVIVSKGSESGAGE